VDTSDGLPDCGDVEEACLREMEGWRHGADEVEGFCSFADNVIEGLVKVPPRTCWSEVVAACYPGENACVLGCEDICCYVAHVRVYFQEIDI